MKNIKHLNTILIVLIMLNYTLFSMILPNDPSVLNEGSDFGKVSTNEIDSKVEEIIEFDTFGMGYAIITRDRIFHKFNLSYYDFNHNLIWNMALGMDNVQFFDVKGFDQYLMVHGINTIIYSLEGTTISTFIIPTTDLPADQLSEYDWWKTRIHDYLIFGDNLYAVEIWEGQFLNNTHKINVILHSYNILTGELNWEKNLISETYNTPDAYTFPTTFVYEYKSLDLSVQLLTIETSFNGLKLTQLELKYNNNELTGINGEENYFVNYEASLDYIILSFDEVIWISETVDGETKITTFESSRGSKLDLETPHFDYGNDKYYDSGMTIINKNHLTDTSTMISGWVNYERFDYGSYIGYLTSDNDLSLNLFNLNDTVIDKMITIDERTVLASLVYMFDLKYEMVIWSFSKIKALNLINPYYINYLPLILLAVLITNLGYKGYKYTKKDKLESST